MSHSKHLCLALFFALLSSSPAQTFAQITVDRSIFYWGNKSPPVQNVAVRNNAEQAMFVELKAEEVIEPGSTNENRILAQDLLVAPKRFSVPAKGERIVRLLRKAPLGAMERVFRVSFVPQSIERTEEEKAQAEIKGGFQTTLKVLSGVGILIFFEPENPNPKLSSERSDDKLVLRNTGNVNILLAKIKRCTKPWEECEEITPKRLYPGNSLEVGGVSGKVVTVTKRIRNEFSDETID